MSKKIMPLFLCVALALSGCHQMIAQDARLRVYASFYPIYALALGVCADVPDLTLSCLTQPQDGCLRAYQLSEWDAALLWDADALLLGGRDLESFQGAFEGGDVAVVSLLDGLSLLGEPASDEEQGHWSGENPWLWLDPAGAADICRAAAGAMAELDPRYAQKYFDNLESMEARLADLAQEMRLPGGGKVAVLHEGFSYLARAMNLTVCASLERESGETVDETRLAAAVTLFREQGVQAVLLEAQAPQALESALRQAGFSVALIDPVTAHQQPSPDTYFDAMRQNAAAVRRALGL